MANLIFEYGVTKKLSDLPPNSIALDGYVQGPEIDNENKRYSFDHHANCVRFCTLSTVEQSFLALQLGLRPDSETKIFSNMLDADTVFSVWLLDKASKGQYVIDDYDVIKAMKEIGLVDAHGPIFKPHPLHEYGVISPAPWEREKQTVEELMKGLKALDEWYEIGKIPVAVPDKEIEAVMWVPGSGLQVTKVSKGFAELYSKGALAGVLIDDAANGTKTYTVGKKSEFVSMMIGPGSDKRPVTDVIEYRIDTLLGALAIAEIEQNPKQGLAENWGGATTVGGSPRNADKSSSVLPPSEVVRIMRRFLPSL